MNLGEVSADVTANTSRFNSGLQDAQSQGNRFATATGSQMSSSFSQSFASIGAAAGQAFTNVGSIMKNVGDSMVSFGSSMTKYITVPITGAITAVFKFGKDFESELAKVTGLVGVSSKQVDQWGKDIIKLAPEVGKAPKELAEALFYVTSAGIKGAEAMDVLEMSAKGSAAGLGETATVADLVTSAMNAYGKENLSAAQATDIITMAVRQGKAEASELAATMGGVLPLASEMGVTFDQVAAAQAAMTRTGTNAAEAETQLKSILSGLLKPSKQAEEQLKAMGTSSSEMRKKIKEDGLLNALMDLRQMTNKFGEEAMARVYPNIRGLMGVLDLMGANLKDNKMVFEEVANAQGTLDDAFKASSETLDFKWNQALTKVQTTALGFFDVIKSAAIPVLDKFVSALDWVSNTFSSLSPAIQKGLLIFATVAAAIGPAIVVVGTIISSLGSIFMALGSVISFVSGIIYAGLLPTIGAVVGIVALVIGIIAGLIASFVYLYNTNTEFKSNVLNIWNSIKEAASTIFNAIKTVIQTIWNGILSFWKSNGDSIINVIQSAWNIILSYIKFVTTVITNVIKLFTSIMKGDTSGAMEAIKNIFNAAFTFIKSIFSNFTTILTKGWSSLINGIITLVIGFISKLKTFFTNMVSIGRELASKLLNAITNIDFKAAGVKIMQMLINGINSMIGKVGNAISSVAKTIRDKLPFSPAKEGPLSDLDKINFYDSINKSLQKAKSKIQSPSLQLGQNLLDNISQSPSLSLNGSSETNSKNINFNGNMNFYGVEDSYQLMSELRSTILRYSGRMV